MIYQAAQCLYSRKMKPTVSYPTASTTVLSLYQKLSTSSSQPVHPELSRCVDICQICLFSIRLSSFLLFPSKISLKYENKHKTVIIIKKMQNKYREIDKRELSILTLSNSRTLFPCSSPSKMQNKPEPILKQPRHKNKKLSFQQKLSKNHNNSNLKFPTNIKPNPKSLPSQYSLIVQIL